MMNHALENSKRESWRRGTNVMEKGKWMFNLRNQATHEESHISKWQTLLNQDIK
jgi:hypothetical protein